MTKDDILRMVSSIGCNKHLNPTDKLIALTMAMTGEKNPKALQEMLGLTKSTSYRSISNVWEFAFNDESLAIPTSPTDGNCSDKKSHQWENSPTSGNGTEPAPVRAQIEYPSDISSLHGCMHAGFEVEGLKGSTSDMVTQIATTLAGEMGTADFQDARRILASNVPVFGPERVKIGFAHWQAKVREGRAKASEFSLVRFFEKAQPSSENLKKPKLSEYELDLQRTQRVMEATAARALQ